MNQDQKLRAFTWALIDALEDVRAQQAGESDWRDLNQADANLRRELEAIDALTATQQAAPSQGAGPDGEELERIIDNYLDGYELRGDGGDHTPSEFESLLIKDAIMGLLVDEAWDKAWGELIRSESAILEASAQHQDIDNRIIESAISDAAMRKPKDQLEASAQREQPADSNQEPSVEEKLHDWHTALERADKPEPQAQAGGPEVVAWALGNPRYVHQSNILPAHEFTPDAEHEDEWTALITLQSHRKAIAKKDAALVYVAHASHATPLHMLPKGVTLYDADGVKVVLPSGDVVIAGSSVPPWERAAITQGQEAQR